MVAVWQLRNKKLSRIKNFERGLNQRYRDITREIPVRALVGDELDDDEFEEYFEWLYYYIDFTNEQIYLRKEGRITHGTWKEWRAGIMSNMKRPAFERAWRKVDSEVDEDFDELRTLIQSDRVSDEDPRAWKDKSGLERPKYWLEQKFPFSLLFPIN